MKTNPARGPDHPSECQNGEENRSVRASFRNAAYAQSTHRYLQGNFGAIAGTMGKCGFRRGLFYANVALVPRRVPASHFSARRGELDMKAREPTEHRL